MPGSARRRGPSLSSWFQAMSFQGFRDLQGFSGADPGFHSVFAEKAILHIGLGASVPGDAGSCGSTTWPLKVWDSERPTSWPF